MDRTISRYGSALTFMPRFVKNMPHALQSRIQTLCGMGGGGGATNGCTWRTRVYGFCHGARAFDCMGGAGGAYARASRYWLMADG